MKAIQDLRRFSLQENFKQTTENLEKRLLFGAYPELEQHPDWQEKEEYLFEIINSYLFKDILVFEGIKNYVNDPVYGKLRDEIEQVVFKDKGTNAIRRFKVNIHKQNLTQKIELLPI